MDTSSTARARLDSRSLIHGLMLCTLTVLLYAGTLDVPFIFDDYPNIRDNTLMRIDRVSLQALYDAGFRSISAHRPVANISFAFNYIFDGYALAGYHAVNLLVHMINGLLVYALALLTFRRQGTVLPANSAAPCLAMIGPAALFAAAVFVAHPVQTQAVTYVVQRMTELCVMFYLAALLLYIVARASRAGAKRTALWVACVLSWLLALGTKQIAITLPLVVLVYEWAFYRDMDPVWLRRNARRIAIAAVLLAALALVFLGTHPIDAIMATYDRRDFTPSERLLTQTRVLVRYLGLLLYPVASRLNIDHQVATSHSLLVPWTTLGSLVLLLGLIGLALRFRQRARIASFFVAWFFITLSVESSFVGLEMMFEHRLYLPSVGFALLGGAIVLRYATRTPRATALVAGLAIFALGVNTHARNSVWQSRVSLWSDAVAKSPDKGRAHSNLATALVRAGRTEAGIVEYHTALRLDPRDAQSHYNLGNILAERGNQTAARQHLETAISLQPGHAKAHFFLARMLVDLGELDAAESEFRAALRLRPGSAQALQNIGAVYEKRGDLEQAVSYYREAVANAPRSGAPRRALSGVLLATGRVGEAETQLLEALAVDPDDPHTHYALAQIKEQREDSQGALEHYLSAVRLKPDYARAHNALGAVLGRLGLWRRAREEITAALSIDADLAEAHHNLGLIVLAEGDVAGAIVEFARALSIKADYAPAYNAMGAAYLEQHEYRRALEQFKRALAIDADYAAARRNLDLARSKLATQD